jgi:NADH-quinone oxidoreductase subunit G
MDVNRWWITDEVRYGWKFVHDAGRITLPRLRGAEPFEPGQAALAYEEAYAAAIGGLEAAGRLALLVSPMLSCEDAFHLAQLALSIDPDAILGVGPVPFHGEDRTFPGGFTVRAEKAPNARGVRRVLSRLSDRVLEFDDWRRDVAVQSPQGTAVIVTGNYPSEWVTPGLRDAVQGKFTIVIDTLESHLAASASVVLPGATWAEKPGTFENVNNRLQAFERAIRPIDFTKPEAQIALDLIARRDKTHASAFDAGRSRLMMADHGMAEFATEVHLPEGAGKVEGDMVVVEL